MPTPNTPNQPLANASVAPDGSAWDQQPAWRQEVPIDTARETCVNRRALLRTALVTGAALIAAKATASALPGQPAKLPKKRLADLGHLQKGSALLFQYPGDHDPCLLVRTGPGDHDYVAFSQACTHLQCPVIPQPEQGRFLCPCHNGAFDLETGKPIQGPPRRPLPRIELSFETDGIYAIGIQQTQAG